MLSQSAVMSVRLFEARGHFIDAIMVLIVTDLGEESKDINRFGETEHSIICSHTFLSIDALNFVLALMLELAEFFFISLQGILPYHIYVETRLLIYFCLSVIKIIIVSFR